MKISWLNINDQRIHVASTVEILLPFLSLHTAHNTADRIENCYRSRICNIQLDNESNRVSYSPSREIQCKDKNTATLMASYLYRPWNNLYNPCSYIEDNTSKNEDHIYIPNNNTEFSHTYRPSLNSNRRNLNSRNNWNTPTDWILSRRSRLLFRNTRNVFDMPLDISLYIPVSTLVLLLLLMMLCYPPPLSEVWKEEPWHPVRRRRSRSGDYRRPKAAPWVLPWDDPHSKARLSYHLYYTDSWIALQVSRSLRLSTSKLTVCVSQFMRTQFFEFFEFFDSLTESETLRFWDFLQQYDFLFSE
jgi:hypothetical protein